MTFRELADSLGIEQPEFPPEIGLGEILKLRLEYIEDVVAAQHTSTLIER